MRIPSALKWLALGIILWMAWRMPIMAHDYAAFRTGLTQTAGIVQPSLAAIPMHKAPLPQPASLAPTPLAPMTVPAGARKYHPAVHDPKPVPHPMTSTRLAMQTPAPPSPAMPKAVEAAPIYSAGPTLPRGNSDPASSGYAHLRAGDRRTGAALLRQAINNTPDDPRAAAWAADYRQLTRRWSGHAYVLTRQGSATSLFDATPSLGGSQIGVRIGYSLDPLSNAPLTLAVRGYQPLAKGSGRSNAAQGAIGLEWQPSRSLPITFALDRYIAIGHRARDDWALRLSVGKDSLPIAHGFSASYYAQAGIIGTKAHDKYADGWARLDTPVAQSKNISVRAGTGIWAGAQPGVSRIDIGPTIEVAGKISDVPINLSLDYRLHVTGYARPGDGFSATLRSGF